MVKKNMYLYVINVIKVNLCNKKNNLPTYCIIYQDLRISIYRGCGKEKKNHDRGHNHRKAYMASPADNSP